MPTVLSDLRKMKTGDLIDAIHDAVCGLGSDEPIREKDLEELFNLVDELRRRSLAGAKGSPKQTKLDS
jgi:hypothetical protein